MGSMLSLPSSAVRFRALRCLFFGSSLASAVLIFHFYRKSLSAERRTSKQQPSTRLTEKGRKAVDAAFLHQLRRLLRLLIPSWRSSAIPHLSLITVLLLVRSLCDVWTIYLGTLLESAIITQNRPRFGRLLLQFGATMPAMALVNSGLKYCTERLQLQFRARLTEALLQAYMRDLTFYKAQQQQQAPSTSKPAATPLSTNQHQQSAIDQLITADVDKLTSTLTALYSQLAKPALDILIYVYAISATVGPQVPAYMCGYLAIAAGLLLRLRAPMSRLTASEARLEGEFRFCNSRLALHAEEVAFYGGGRWELHRLLDAFAALRRHLAAFAEFKFVVQWAENVVAKYAATVVGYYAVSRPFLAGGPRSIALAALSNQDRLETYYKSGRMLVNLAQAIGRLVINGKDVAKLAGVTSRVHGLMEELEGLHDKPTATAVPGTGEGAPLDDDSIHFDRVPVVTPAGDVLLRELSLTLRPGVNVLICGPNGCGKSSLFRILGGLWPLLGGSLTKPGGNLFYIPQRPYMPLGTLRDQIIYPDTVQEMHAKGRADEDLEAILRVVDLDWLVGGGGRDGVQQHQQAPGGAVARLWDSVENWMDVLSGGQKQRLAMARLLYHRPRFAILDECTSAVSVDVEGTIYSHCKAVGITLMTVSHRRSLWAHHDHFLRMDGRGGYEFGAITEETQSFGT